MPFTALLCTDGSDLSLAALGAGLRVVATWDRLVVVTVVDVVDPTLVLGTGMAGGVVSPIEAERMHDAQVTAAQEHLEATCAALGLMSVETTVVAGAPGPTLCELAAALPASVMVIGTRGRGGLRRAVLGSVSDHVVRHAPCPVVTVGPAAEPGRAPP